jgi:hypothetical protein
VEEQRRFIGDEKLIERKPARPAGHKHRRIDAVNPIRDFMDIGPRLFIGDKHFHSPRILSSSALGFFNIAASKRPVSHFKCGEE